MIDLHYWPTPNGWKLSIMLEECGLPYRMVPVNIGKGEQFAPEFLAISPNNRMPAIVDHSPAGRGPAVAGFESGACLLCLAEKTGQFMPADLRGRYAVTQWLMWQMERWYNGLFERPAVKRGLYLGKDLRAGSMTGEARKALFGQTAQSVKAGEHKLADQPSSKS